MWERLPLPAARTPAFALGAFVLVAALVLGVVIVYGTVANAGSSRAVHSYAKHERGVAYSSRAGRFRAVFPAHPTTTAAAATTSEGLPTTAHVIESKPGSAYRFAVRYEDQAIAPGDANAVLDASTSQLAASGRTLLPPAESQFGRATVRDVYSHHAGTYYRDRLIVVDNRIYTIEVASPDRVPEGWDRFVQSFTLIAAS